MTQPLPSFSLSVNLPAFVAALIGAAFVWLLCQYHGVGVSPDSVVYAGVARNMGMGKWLREFNDSPLVIFPAGYPFFLGGLAWMFHTDVLAIAPMLNGLLMGMSIYVGGCMIASTHWLTRILVLAILPFHPSLLEVFTMLWSETLFICLTLLFIYALHRYLFSPQLGQLLIMSLLSAFVCDTRFAGISVWATGALFILLQYQLSWAKRWIHGVIFSLLSASLLTWNLWHNVQEQGTMTGIRQASQTSLITNVVYSSKTLLEWLYITTSQHLWIAFPVMVLLGVLAINLIANCKHQKNKVDSAQLLRAFALAYICCIVLSATISRYEPINNRFLSPAFIPLVVGCLPALERWVLETAKGKRKWLLAFVLLPYLAIQWRQINNAITTHTTYKEVGIPGYAEMDWQESDLVQYLQAKPKLFNSDTLVFSNDYEAAYYFGHIPAYSLPESVHTKAIAKYQWQKPHFLLWFSNEFNNKDLIQLPEIGRLRRLDTLMVFKDGMILRSSPPMAHKASQQ